MSNQLNYQREFGRLSSMPTWALVLAFLMPPVGAIMGHVALKDLKSGQISSLNRSLALAAVIAGWAITGLALIFMPFLALVLGISGFIDSLNYK